MARTVKLVYGATEISLLSLTGIIPSRGGLGRTVIATAQIEKPTIQQRYVESWKLNLIATSHNNAATQLRALRAVLRAARLYHTTDWQITPVYLVEQTNSESNARYALVYGSPELEHPDWFTHPFELDNLIEEFGLGIERGVWRSGQPGTLPTAVTLTKSDGPADGTEMIVANFRDDVALTHLYNYDASVPAFSANLYNGTAISLWSVSGSTPAAGDIIYIGSTTAPWHQVVLEIAMAGGFIADVVIESYISGAWMPLTAGSGFSLYPTGDEDGIFKATGIWCLNVNPGANWQTVTINAVTAYWVSIRLNAVTSWTGTPVTHATHTPYLARSPHVEMADTVLCGDMAPVVLLRLRQPYGGTTSPSMATTSRILISAKSRNLDEFVSHLNLGNAGNPGAWTTYYGTDAASAADPTAPRGSRADITFATASTMQIRVTLSGTGMHKWAGVYRVFLRAYQVGGAAGDCQVRLRIRIGSISDGYPMQDLSTVRLKTKDAGWEIVELGYLSIPFGKAVSADNLGATLVLQIMAERTTGSSTLRLADLILMPVDEWAVTLDDPLSNVSIGSSALRGGTMLDLDGGVLVNRTLKYQAGAGGAWHPAEAWNRDGAPPTLEPDRQTRLYFLMMHYPSTFGTGPFVSTLGMQIGVNVYAHAVYEALRGDD
jgi:hypothetical protein